MTSKLLKEWGLRPSWLRFFILTVLVLGVFFRLVNLGGKIYWHDETYTSLRISGYTRLDVLQQAFDGRVIGVEDLQKYQRLNPEKNWFDTVKGLAAEEPQHPPLYFLLARWWAQMFGSGAAAIRSLPAIISLLVFPAVFWLCWELFESPLVGWVAIALLAVSPFHVLYAQEARQYSLWTVAILLSSAACLRAQRLQNRFNWGMYAATVALGLNTHLMAVFVAIGEGISVVSAEKFRFFHDGKNRGYLNKTIVAYLLASIAGAVAFLPWLVVVLGNLNQTRATTYWSLRDLPLLQLVRIWVLHISWLFFDVLYGYDGLDDVQFNPFNVPFNFQNPFTYLSPLILILVGYSLYFLWRHTSLRVWFFIFSLIGVTAGVLVLPDLILGGQRSTAARYLIPTFLGIQVAIAYLLASKIAISVKSWQQYLWRLVLVVIISGGVLSCAVSSQAQTWWNKDNYFFVKLSRTINQTSQPLIVSDTPTIGGILSLNHLLEPKVQLQLVEKPNIPNIPSGFSDVFLYRPSKTLQKGLEAQNYQVEVLKEFGKSVWGGYWVAKLSMPSK